MHETLVPNHEAMMQVTPVVEAMRDEHDLEGTVEFIEAKHHVEDARLSYEQLVDSVGKHQHDQVIAEYIHDVEEIKDSSDELPRALAIGAEELRAHPFEAPHTAAELLDAPTEQLGEALRDIALVEDDATVETIIEALERSNLNSEINGSGIPEFDRLDDYSPEFSGQILLHRSNGEMNPGDIVLPSDQISEEMHEELNGRRSFQSTSRPGASKSYDQQLAHAGTRDYGHQYGKYLYVVEPIEGDTLKWGENFGMPNFRHHKAESPAIDRTGLGRIGNNVIDPSGGRFARTDSYTGKQFNEVVSTQGFRVVKRIEHEPNYEKALLPWPVSMAAARKHEARRDNETVAIMHDDGTILVEKIRTSSRKNGNKIGSGNNPGSFRAEAHKQVPANLQNRFDLRKQQAENLGQMTLPDMPISKFRKKHEVPSYSEPYFEPNDQLDTPLPGMEKTVSSRPMM